MLDLKKLENKIDTALANETEESLTNWLLSKRLDSYLQTLGKGAIEDVPLFLNEDIILEPNSTSFKAEYFDMSCSSDYLIAA